MKKFGNFDDEDQTNLYFVSILYTVEAAKLITLEPRFKI
jgi:hypothetical protein